MHMDHSDARLLEAVLQAIPEPFFIYDREGTYVDVIGGSDRNKYHDARALIGMTLYEVFPMATAKEFHEQILRAIDSQEVVTFEYSVNPDDVGVYRDKPGPVGLRWFEAHIAPLRGERDHAPMAVWVAFDITDHKRLAELQEEQKRKLKELASTDALTGFLNRRSLYEAAQLEVRRVQEQLTRGLSLCLIDIDHFKAINDTYGHQTGDKVLSFFARTVQRSIRTNDIAARIGGEEFVILFPDCDLLKAVEAAERIRSEVERTVYLHEKSALSYTVSIGVAKLSDGEIDIQKALSRADTAMYAAKGSGRNCVCSDPPVGLSE